jgi:hypothetical protein
MKPGKPQTRFLLRGSSLLIGVLVLWWFVLSTPLLFLLRGSLEFTGSLIFGGNTRDIVTLTPSGDWSVRVPLEKVVVEFDVARADVITFTFSLPVYWAIMLAMPGIRRSVRPLVLGTVVVAALEVIMLLVFIEISAHRAAAQMAGVEDETSRYIRRFGEYMVVNVVPYAAPFLIAISLHVDLRRQILGWGPMREHPVTQPSTKTRKRRDR